MVNEKLGENKKSLLSRGMIARKSILIHASPSQVWNALTNPAMIKQYLFGTDVSSDWKVGSTITYRGAWQGKSYEDKGKIVKIIPGKLLQSTFLSSMSGLEDKEENYALVTYELEPRGEDTQLTVTQDNNDDEASREHSEKNWGMVLETMKKLLENDKS